MLNQNDYKLLFLDVLKDFKKQGYNDFTIQENFIPPEAVPEENRKLFLEKNEIAIDQKLYGYTITLHHASNVIYFNFAVFNLREEYINKGIAEGHNPIALLPPEWVQRLWHQFFVDIMCAGMIRNRDIQYEAKGERKPDNATNRSSNVDLHSEKKQRVIRMPLDPKRDIN